MHVSVPDNQVNWMADVIKQHHDARFKIVQGHVPIWGKLKARASSKLMLEFGRNSRFYEIVNQHGVNLYL